MDKLKFIGVATLFLAVFVAGVAFVSAQSESVSNNDCTGGQCGAEIDSCSTSGTQCYTPQYCTEYNTPRFSSPLRVTTEAGRTFSYEVMVAQVNPNPTRDLAPWEHPLIQERRPFEAGWFGANVTSADIAGLAGSGLSANPNSVVVQKRLGVPQIPNSTGLIISGVPTTPGTYSVALNTRNDLEEWIFEAGGSDNQSSTFAGVSSDMEYVKTRASCSSADVLEIQVTESAQCTSETPTITSSDNVTGQVGTPFSYRATATDNTSLSMSCETLPAGTLWNGPLSIEGTPTVAGTFSCVIHAENSRPSCTTYSATKNVTIVIAPVPACATSTPVITSSGSVTGIIGGNFSGYTIQTSLPADSYSIIPSGGDFSFPNSLVVINNGRSLEGQVSATQPKQQYNFQAIASTTLPSGIQCSNIKNVVIGLSCPSARPNWNPETGQCTDRQLRVCRDSTASNFGALGECRFDVCNQEGALNRGERAACRFPVCVGAGCVGICTNPTAINFGQTGSCRPRTSCGLGETGTPPNCREIACPNCGVTKMCDVCVERANNGSCLRRESRPAAEAPSQSNSCGLKRSLYYCPDESSNPPPPPGEQACDLPVTVVTPSRQLIQKGGHCMIPWEVSGVREEQNRPPHPLICVLSGPNFSVRVAGSSGQVETSDVDTQSIFKFVCRNGDAKISNESSFTCRVNPRFEER